MEVSTFIFLGALFALVLYGVILYNNLVSLKHNVGKAWSNIDVLLKQRHDEILKLVETCKGYMKQEQETFEKVMLARSAVASARQQSDVGALGPAESQLRMGWAISSRLPKPIRNSRQTIIFNICKTAFPGLRIQSLIAANSITTVSIPITSA